MLVQIQVLLMQIFSGSLAKFRDDERGASAIEYAVIAAIMVGIVIAAIVILDLGGIFTGIKAEIDAA
jgi:pilus assembly protein Flp/PilA